MVINLKSCRLPDTDKMVMANRLDIVVLEKKAWKTKRKVGKKCRR